MDRFESMQSYMTPAQEGALTAIGMIALYAAGIGALAHYAHKRDDKKAAEEQKRKDIERAKAEQANREAYLAKLKVAYKADITKQELSSFKNARDLYNHMEADVKKWINNIKNTQQFAQYITKGISYDPEYVAEMLDTTPDKLTPRFFAQAFDVGEGVNGWEETIEVCNWDQTACVILAPIIKDICILLSTKYPVYCSNGDGDEGHIYYHDLTKLFD